MEAERYGWKVNRTAPNDWSTSSMTAGFDGTGAPIAALWAYLSSWLSPDGGVNGPVVHRGDLKRMFSIHDTPWTQHGVIAGLLHLYRRSGRAYWLDNALKLADAQCARLEADGRFRWAGHEDDRFSSLVHNALADCALLDVAAVLECAGGDPRRDRYLRVAETNLEHYIVDVLYRRELTGFVMNPVDYYAGRDRFVVNMNSVALEALVKLDQQRGTTRHLSRVQAVGDRILELQTRDGPCRGSFPYSDLEPDTHIPLYTALAIRGFPALADLRQDTTWAEAAKQAAAFLDRARDVETGFWCHKFEPDRVYRFPFFVAGAGMICNGMLDAAEVTGEAIDVASLIDLLLRHQYGNGAIRNFIGYDHPDNGGFRSGVGATCWEDAFPTPNWNAQAFHFLCRVLPPPDPPDQTNNTTPATVMSVSNRYLYRETENLALIVGTWPPGTTVFAFYVKRLRYGFLVPGFLMTVRVLRKVVERSAMGRVVLSRLRTVVGKARESRGDRA